MSKEERKEISPEEFRKEIRDKLEKGFEEFRKKFEEFKERRREIIDDKTLTAVGISFVIGFALGVILSKSKE
jgi:ElaB/YqjD/DUF883 family membrane-anchored ribosome-binding protein